MLCTPIALDGDLSFHTLPVDCSFLHTAHEVQKKVGPPRLLLPRNTLNDTDRPTRLQSTDTWRLGYHAHNFMVPA